MAIGSRRLSNRYPPAHQNPDRRGRLLAPRGLSRSDRIETHMRAHPAWKGSASRSFLDHRPVSIAIAPLGCGDGGKLAPVPFTSVGRFLLDAPHRTVRLKNIEPAYQDPDRRGDRRGRAQVTCGYTRRSMDKVYHTHRYSPAYQDPDRRGRAQVTCGYTRRSNGWKVYYTHRYSPAYQDPDRPRAQVTCGYVQTIVRVLSFASFFELGPPLRGVGP
jgi:hypothetical protein